jgi:hypothetical protein
MTAFSQAPYDISEESLSTSTTVAPNYLTRIVAESATIDEAIDKMKLLSNDSRKRFIRTEDMSDYERYVELKLSVELLPIVIQAYDRVHLAKSGTRCVAGVLVGAATGAGGGCLTLGKAGLFGGPKGGLLGCAVGGFIGGIGGAFLGGAESC